MPTNTPNATVKNDSIATRLAKHIPPSLRLMFAAASFAAVTESAAANLITQSMVDGRAVIGNQFLNTADNAINDFISYSTQTLPASGKLSEVESIFTVLEDPSGIVNHGGFNDINFLIGSRANLEAGGTPTTFTFNFTDLRDYNGNALTLITDSATESHYETTSPIGISAQESRDLIPTVLTLSPAMRDNIDILLRDTFGLNAGDEFSFSLAAEGTVTDNGFFRVPTIDAVANAANLHPDAITDLLVNNAGSVSVVNNITSAQAAHFITTSVPEPSSFLLLVIGGSLLLYKGSKNS